MKYDFTEQEVDALISLIDLAIKAGGLRVAENGIVLTKKLQNPIKEEEKV